MVVTVSAGSMVMEKSWVALGEMPLVAVTVPLKVPAAVGVPESTPAELSVNPDGSVPEVREYVMGVVPVAV